MLRIKFHGFDPKRINHLVNVNPHAHTSTLTLPSFLCFSISTKCQIKTISGSFTSVLAGSSGGPRGKN